MPVQAEDFSRLAAELGGQDQAPDEWAEKAGIEWDALGEVMGGMVDMARSAFMESIHEEIEAKLENDPPEEGEMVMGYGIMNIGDLIANACLHAFILGYETCAQYRSQD